MAIESPSKMMKDAVYFTLIALLVIKNLTFFPDFFGRVGKSVDKGY